MSQDPEDEQQEVNLGRKFTFRGAELSPYSFNHRAALLRLGNLTDYEFCAYLIRILMLSIPDVDGLRSEEALSKFRIAAGKWADDEGVSRGKGLEELQSLVDTILADVNKAEELVPKPVAKKKPVPHSKHRGRRSGT